MHRLAARRAGPPLAGLRPAPARARATRPTATTRPTAPGGTTRTGRRGSRRAGPPASPTPRPRPTCSRPCARAPTTTPAEQVVELLNRGVAPQSIWDALFDGAGELLLRQPGIVSLHAVTTTNALHYAYQASGDDLTRRLLMLQNAAFLTLFRGALGGRGKAGEARIDQLEPAGTSEAKDGTGAIEEIFAEASHDKMAAARKALAYLQAGHDPEPLIHAARRLVFLKGDDAHDYKFSSAVLEDYYHASPSCRERYLAASMLLLPGSADKDNNLVKRTRAALRIGPTRARWAAGLPTIAVNIFSG